MSAQTQVYLFNQRQYVVLLENNASATRRYETVYAKELILNRGVDNLLEFAFINQEQKPVNITDKDISCRILDSTGSKILLQKGLTPQLPITGIASLTVTAEETLSLEAQNCYYSLQIPVGIFDYPVFVDSNSGARGTIRIVNSVFPSFVESHEITIPSHLPPLVGTARTYYTSIVNTKQNSMATVQIWVNNFTGNIQLEGSTLPDFSNAYPINSLLAYVAETSSYITNIIGFHPYLRFKIVNQGTPPAVGSVLRGDVAQILIR